MLTNNAPVRTSEDLPLLSNVSKRIQFSCQGFTCTPCHGRIARLTEHDDVIKPLRRRTPRLGLVLGPGRDHFAPSLRPCMYPRLEPLIQMKRAGVLSLIPGRVIART